MVETGDVEAYLSSKGRGKGKGRFLSGKAATADAATHAERTAQCCSAAYANQKSTAPRNVRSEAQALPVHLLHRHFTLQAVENGIASSNMSKMIYL